MGEINDFENEMLREGLLCWETRMLIENCDCKTCRSERFHNRRHDRLVELLKAKFATSKDYELFMNCPCRELGGRKPRNMLETNKDYGLLRKFLMSLKGSKCTKMTLAPTALRFLTS